EGVRVRADAEERDVAEVEQARPADDDVETEREEGVVERVEADALVVAVARRDSEDPGRGDEDAEADRRVDARDGPLERAEGPAASLEPLARARDPLVGADSWSLREVAHRLIACGCPPSPAGRSGGRGARRSAARRPRGPGRSCRSVCSRS